MCWYLLCSFTTTKLSVHKEAFRIRLFVCTFLGKTGNGFVTPRLPVYLLNRKCKGHQLDIDFGRC